MTGVFYSAVLSFPLFLNMGLCCSRNKRKVGGENSVPGIYEGFSSASEPPPPPTNEGDEKYFKVHGDPATFALGSFWIPAAKFGVALGVIRLRCGYIGGVTANPTYLEINDYTEAIDLEFDNTKTSYGDLLELFWKSHQPWEYKETHDKSAIYYHTEEQKKLAEESMIAEQNKHDKDFPKFRTEILPATKFISAELEQQHYLLQAHETSILHELNLSSREELIYSHVACRINGYVEGYGSKRDFEEELSDLCLPKSVADYVRKLNDANDFNNEPLCGFVSSRK